MDTDEKEYIKEISDLIIKLKGKEVKAVYQMQLING